MPKQPSKPKAIPAAAPSRAPLEPAPPSAPRAYRQTVYVGLKAGDLRRVKRVVDFMQSQPIYLEDDIGLAKAIRFAIDFAVRHMPPQVSKD